MAPNKLTSMLHRRANRITHALKFAVLEWTLISLLLLNSFFSFLILKFARYFGLKPPCVFCSRLDHYFLDTHKNKCNDHSKFSLSPYAEVICEQHAAEISKIGYCSHHRKLVEAHSICHDCSSVVSSQAHQKQDGAVLRWMREIGIVSTDAESTDDHDVNKCSCCEVIIRSTKAPSLDGLEQAKVITDRDLGDLVINHYYDDHKFEYEPLENDADEDEDEDENEDEDEDVSDDQVVFKAEKEPLLKDGDHIDIDISHDDSVLTDQNLCPDMLPQHLEFYIDHDDYRLIPVELLHDSREVQETEIQSHDDEEMSKEVELVFEGNELVLTAGNKVTLTRTLSTIEEDREDDNTVADAEILSKGGSTSENEEEEKENDDENSQTSQEQEVEDGTMEMNEQSSDIIIDEDESKVENAHIFQVQAENLMSENVHILLDKEEEDRAVELTSEFSQEENAASSRVDVIPTESNQDTTDEFLEQEEQPPTPRKRESRSIIDDIVYEASTSSGLFAPVVQHDTKRATEAEAENCRESLAEFGEEMLKINVAFSPNEADEERIPDTPSSVESIQHLHKKISLLGRRDSVTEESVDGSMVSEVEGGDSNVAVEKLKSELHAERKAFRSLYKELEEERNASAIAANHTMAMISRLQEEKATMQMEASQYQRMMEEQSEYDQEALQMMNELVVKREKEKQELEKELELYRKKIIEYEEKERMRLLNRRRENGSLRSRNSSATCSFAGEESDGLSVDLNHEAKDNHEDDIANGLHSHDENGHQDTPTDAVICLQESFTGFEEERQAILEQLKALEEKLFSLAEEEEDHIENMKPFEEFYDENGKEFDVNEDEDGYSHVNGKHLRINGSMPKRLLPLFDAAEFMDSPNSEMDGREDEFHSVVLNKSPITNFDIEKKRMAIEQEVDQVYERLQALEADREFLKHCIGSLRKGDKGLDLLQEILQHLRDLKNVELQAIKNMDHCASV